jgi:hypothetical protein
MPHHAGVFEEGVLAFIDMVVGAANAHAAWPHEHFVAAAARRWPALQGQFPGALAHQGVNPIVVRHVNLRVERKKGAKR